MYPVTTSFKYAVNDSHKARVKCEVWDGADVIREVPVVGGSVSLDSSRSVRAGCNMAFYADGLIPTSGESDFYPATNELHIWRGVDVVDGVELVPLGVFGFEDVDVGEGPDGITLEIAGSDRAAMASRSLLLEPLSITKDTTPYDAISALLATVSNMPGVVNAANPPDTWLMPAVRYQAGADPWAMATNIATAFGAQLYVDRLGVPRFEEIPDPDTSDPALTYNMDAPGAPVLRVNRTISTANTFNGVIASGEGTDLVRPLQAESWDTDPLSPFYYEGPYGKKPYFYSSPLILELDQAKAAARAKLKQIMGGIETATWDAICNPAIDPYDVISMKRTAIGLDEQFSVESVSIPLMADSPMQVSGRTALYASDVEL